MRARSFRSRRFGASDVTQSLPAARLAEAYEVIEVVRRGGLSTTFRARHRGSGDLRCIDVLRPAPGARDALERRLDAEARPLMELRHPNVARLVDAAVGEGGEACLVRENHDGATLRRLTGSQRPSVALAVELLCQTADALAFLHQRGRKVGDLSPEGLLLGRASEDTAQMVVADLGLAKDWQEEASLTAAGLFVGRLRYAAPEQFDAAGRKGAPGDVYALGLVAYELLTGRHPITGDSASSLIAGHLFRPPVEFSESDPEGRVPEALRQIVLSALAKDAEKRPTATALRDELASLQAELPAIEGSEIDRWLGPRGGQVPSGAPGDAPTETQAAIPAEAQLETWLEEAHALAREEEFLAAREKVRQVLKVQPDHSMGLMLLASLEACLKIQVEESNTHQTLVMSPESGVADTGDETADASGTQDLRDTLVGGTATVQLPVVGGEPALGTETVRVTAEDLRQMTAEASDPRPEVEPAQDETPADEPPDDVGAVDESTTTQRLDAMSQIPGGPGSTERLDLDGDPSTRIQATLDDDKTRPLSPDLLRQVTAAEPPSEPSALGDGTTQLLNEELPGTVTMPMEQIEAQKRRALQTAGDRPMDAVAEGFRPSLDDTVSPEVTLPVRTDVRPRPATAAPRQPATTAAPTQPGTAAPTPRPAAPPSAEPQAASSWGVISEPTEPVPQQPASPKLPEPASRPAPAPPSDSVPAPSTEPATPQAPAQASVDQLGFGGAPAPAYESREPRGRRGRGRRGRGRSGGPRRGAPESKSGGTWIMVGAAIAAVLVFGFGYAVSSGVDLRQLVGLGDAEQVVPPSELPPVAVEPGRLLLDAAPWAEIVQISDSLGEDVPLRFRHTPARYELAPGPYTVVVAGPDGQSKTLDVEVVSEQDVEVRPVFEEMSVADYFRRMGWR